MVRPVSAWTPQGWGRVELPVVAGGEHYLIGWVSRWQGQTLRRPSALSQISFHPLSNQRLYIWRCRLDGLADPIVRRSCRAVRIISDLALRFAACRTTTQ